MGTTSAWIHSVRQATFSNPTHLYPFAANKFKAKRTEYNGRTYHSKREAEFAAELDLRLRVQGPDRIVSWRPQVRIPLVVDGVKVCDYIVDFELTYADGRTELVEVKGFQTPEFKIKRRLFEATWLREHPDVKYSIVQ